MKVFRPRKKIRLDMLPMIDVVFLLLVFFIYAMMSMAVHHGVPVDLPSGNHLETSRDNLVSLTLKNNGNIYVDKEPVDKTRLAEELGRRIARPEEAGVLIFGDREISYQMLFEVIDTVRGLGVSRLSLQAEVPGP
ncbi:biopolymer transporter ExbD [Desulfatiferula olefinivorans]